MLEFLISCITSFFSSSFFLAFFPLIGVLVICILIRFFRFFV